MEKLPKPQSIPTLAPTQLDEHHFNASVGWLPTLLSDSHLFHFNRIEIYRSHMAFPLSPHRKTVFDFIYLTRGHSVRSNQPPNSYPVVGVDVFQGSWLTFQPTADLVNENESKDGLPITTSPLYSAATPYESRDPRLRMSIFVPGDNAEEGWLQYNYSQDVFQPFTGGSTTGFAPKKMVDPKRPNPQYTTISDQDYVLIRYAEVLLAYAEAENEAAGPANAYTAINQIRARAGMPALPTGLSQATCVTGFGTNAGSNSRWKDSGISICVGGVLRPKS